VLPVSGQRAPSRNAQVTPWADFLSIRSDHPMQHPKEFNAFKAQVEALVVIPPSPASPLYQPSALATTTTTATYLTDSSEAAWTLTGLSHLAGNSIVGPVADLLTPLLYDNNVIYRQADGDQWSWTHHTWLSVAGDQRRTASPPPRPASWPPAATRNWAFIVNEGGSPLAWSSVNGGWAAQAIDGLNTQTDTGDGYWFGTGLRWNPPPKMLIMSDQFGTPGSGNIDMAQAANGAYNHIWNNWLQSIASKAPNVIVVRIWQEINGNWMSWSVNRTGRTASDGTPNGSAWPVATIIAAWRNMAHQVRIAFPNALIEWNLNSGGPFSRPTSPGNGSGFDLYPGDDVVDVIGIDSYEKNATFGIAFSGGGVNLTNLAAYAKAHNKLIAWSETAAQGCDGAYLASIAQWLDRLGSMAAYFSYYDQGSANNGDNILYSTSGTDSCAASRLRAALNASSFGTKRFGGKWSKVQGN
jgi:hypothetical protein